MPHLKPFTPEEARAFLFRRTGRDDPEAADRLAELLGHLPLALEQAGAFIAQLGLSLEGYIRLFEEQRQHLWQRETPPPGYKATVTTTWELSFQRIRANSPAGIALLNLCTFFAPDDIPLSVFRSGEAYLPAELAAGADNPLQLEDAVAALYRYSLIASQGDSLSIHRLVQEVARDRLGPDRVPEWLEIAVNLVKHAFSYDQYDMATWPRCSRLLPHALAVVAHAERYQVALAPAAAIWQRTGEYLREYGEYAKARVSIEHALRIRTELFGEDHEEVAESLDYLGELCQEQASYAEAYRYHQRALDIREKRLGREHAETAKSLNNLGALSDTLGRYEQAREYYEAALAIRKQVLGEQHPDTAMSLSNLGSLFQSQGKYEQAREYYEAALAIRKQVLGEQHPDTATSLNNSGTRCLQDSG